MNSRNVFKAAAAAILAIGVLAGGVTSPASAAGATVSKAPKYTTHDTGWGFK